MMGKVSETYLEQVLQEKLRNELYTLEIDIPGVKLLQPLLKKGIVVVPIREGVKIFVYLNQLPDISTQIVEVIKQVLNEEDKQKTDEKEQEFEEEIEDEFEDDDEDVEEIKVKPKKKKLIRNCKKRKRGKRKTKTKTKTSWGWFKNYKKEVRANARKINYAKISG